VIHFDSVSKRYDNGFDALSGLSFRLGAGEMAFVTGHSGAGKSTLLKLIALIERPSHGAIRVGGDDLRKVRGRNVARLRRGIGMVFQDHRLLMDRSVAANVELPLVIAGVPKDERARRVRAALDKVGLLAYEKQPPIHLSTGEQQRVGIARAIVAKPSLIIADEPTGNLDPLLSLEVMSLFRAINAKGTTVLVATHDRALIRHLGKRVITLEHGQVTETV
jgi:cell division transport system ATP-binding protein